MATDARRLRRSRRNKMIFGVAGGLAERFNIDPAIVRILFILLAFANGIGVLLYLLLAFFIPREEAEPTQPLQTFGENVKTMPKETEEAARRILDILRGAPGDRGPGGA